MTRKSIYDEAVERVIRRRHPVVKNDPEAIAQIRDEIGEVALAESVEVLDEMLTIEAERILRNR